MSKKINVDVEKIIDVRKKELLYLIIGDYPDEIIINVGKKTFDNVNKLLNDDTEKSKKTDKEIQLDKIAERASKDSTGINSKKNPKK